MLNICEGRVGMLIWTRVAECFVTYHIDQRPSSEASKSYSTQEIPCSWWNPSFITVFTWACPFSLSWTSWNYLHPPILFLQDSVVGLPGPVSCRFCNQNSVSFLTHHASCTTYSSFLIRSPFAIRLKSTNNFAHHYGGFSGLLLLPFSLVHGMTG